MKTKRKDRINIPWKQNDPFGVQIEPVQGCTNFCSFCGIKAVAEKAFNRMKLMEIDTASMIADQMYIAGWGEKRLVIAMAGEPTFHPKLCEMIEVFKDIMPKLHVTLFTNGYRFGKDPSYVARLYEAGCNTVLLDDYSFSRVDKINEVIANIPDNVLVTTYKENSPFHKHSKKMFITNKDHCESGDGGHQRYSVCNVAANGGPPTRVKAERMCARPFREVVVLWDGRVVLCCADYRGVICYGNVNDPNGRFLGEMWHSPLMYAVRKLVMQSGRKDLWPCCICDTQTMRNGLLPNNLGRKQFEPGLFDMDDKELERVKDFIRRELAKHDPSEYPQLPWEAELKSSREKYINPTYKPEWERASNLATKQGLATYNSLNHIKREED